MKRVSWKYNIGNNIVIFDEDGNKKIDIVITNREIRQSSHKRKNSDEYDTFQEKFYEYSCNICGAYGLWRRESVLTSYVCSCCAGRVRIKGINTIGDKYQELVEFIGNDAFDESLTLESYYPVVCKKCGNEKNMRLGHLLDQQFACDYCNSLGNIHPSLIELLVDKRDAMLPHMSSKKVQLKCPDCGNMRTMALQNLSRDGFYCNICSDGLPFTEKFIISVFRQLNVSFITQANKKQLPWAAKYRYDFYLPEHNAIIEAHGCQHYFQYGESKGRRTISEEKENDENKRKLAIDNGIEKYIVINCSQSTQSWISNEILHSELSRLFDLSRVQWDECTKFATSNIFKLVCDYWKENCDWTSTTDLSNKFKLSVTTIVKYLKRGTDLGWCAYDPDVEREKAKEKTKTVCSKKVLVLKNGKLIGEFCSVAELARQAHVVLGRQLSGGSISEICRGILKQIDPFEIKYAEEIWHLEKVELD